MMYLRIKNPVSDIGIRIGHRIRSVCPRGLDLSKKRILARSGTVLCFYAFSFKVALQLWSLPCIIWRHDLVVPILLDEVLKIFAVGWSRERDVVILQPTFQFRFMPTIIDLITLSTETSKDNKKMEGAYRIW